MDATDLEFIPRAVRDKLDRVAIKLHLAQWQALTLEERCELWHHLTDIIVERDPRYPTMVQLEA